MYLKETAITPPVDIDWFGMPLNVEFRFILQVEADSIVYGAQFPVECLSLGKQGEFIEGLWQRSVVELFIYDAASPRYIELNLSPTGAYWGAEFSEYRVRKSELKFFPTIDIKSVQNQKTVLCRVSHFDIVDFRLSQTAILSLPEKPSESLYLSRKFAWGVSAQAKLAFKPDFHKKELVDSF